MDALKNIVSYAKTTKARVTDGRPRMRSGAVAAHAQLGRLPCWIYKHTLQEINGSKSKNIVLYGPH